MTDHEIQRVVEFVSKQSAPAFDASMHEKLEAAGSATDDVTEEDEELVEKCLEIIRQVEKSGKTVAITRRGKVVARLQPPLAGADQPDLKPWERLRMMGGRLLAAPEESALKDGEFDALR